MIRLLALFILLATMSSAAQAQTYSYTSWSIAGTGVTLRVTLPEVAVRTLVGNGVPAVTNLSLARYVADHVDVHEGGAACPPIDQGQDVGLIDTLAPLPGLYRFEIVFRCSNSGALRLDSHILFARVPDHLDFARIQLPDGSTVTRLFDTAHQSITIPANRTLADTSLLAYTALGGSQLISQTARIAFVLALLLGLRRREDWITAAVGLTGGYALSITLAAGGVASARPEVAETAIGLLTLLLAARAATTTKGQPRTVATMLTGVILLLGMVEYLTAHTQHAMLLLGEALLVPCLLLLRSGPARSLPWLIPTLLFGVLDGAGFSAAVVTIGLPGHAAVLPLAGRHLGALLAIALLGAAAALSVWVARQRSRRSGRPLLADFAAAGLAGFGMFWFVFRLHA